MKKIFFLFFLITNACYAQVSSIGGIINNYTPVLAMTPCQNTIVVEDASAFKTGDTVYMVQMKGAVVDSSNTASFGTVLNYGNAGNYSKNYISSITGHTLTLINNVTKNFDIPEGKVQLVRVPFYNNVTITSTLSCLPWDGSKGGIVILHAQNNITLDADIDVTGKGFRGGIISNNPDGDCGAGSPDYFYPLSQSISPWVSGGAQKGEGIAEISIDKMAGKGTLANGGGGGNKHNTGGGGGSNYGQGGIGGNELAGCTIAGNGGIGGKSLKNADLTKKTFLGGGGGCGDDNNKVGTPGANGGGMVIINAANITAGTGKISANGNSQLIDGTGIADGAGGGGGGGSILLFTPTTSGNFLVEANGGNGGNQNADYGCVGPGGGGGGGYIAIQQASIPANISFTVVKGKAGIIKNSTLPCYNTTYGAADGTDGFIATNFSPLIDSPSYKKNIELVIIKDSLTNCNSFNFDGSAITNYKDIEEWNWDFGDGNTAGTQNTTHTYTRPGKYLVQLFANDGICGETVTKLVSTLDTVKIVATKSNDIDCAFKTATLSARGGSNYIWSPALGLNDSTLANPVATLSQNQQYILQGMDSITGCFGFDTILVLADFGTAFPLFIPNAFSPNGDGINDCYHIKYDGPLKNLELSIYNRWGERVFHTTNINDCWDGIYKHRPAEEDTYVYYVRVINNCKQIVDYGNLVLIR